MQGYPGVEMTQVCGMPALERLSTDVAILVGSSAADVAKFIATEQ